ncbi:uncharacterized protein LOC114371338 [Glycine soja]|uniref:uncharacterized protein LOC114371338 n=1 Tax=Glycine soja TaxID=3848 RepID=UPI00103B4F39|nr:uncharacterized protein LOC114371338 [Glycine soja]
MEDMIRDLAQEGFLEAHAPYYEDLETDSKLSLYFGCTTFTRLSAVLALVNLKARFGWSDKSLTELLVLLKNMLPNDNKLPNSHYEAKKILCPVGLEYKMIHACHNDCVLYRKEFAELRNCPTCGVSRYKQNDGEYTDDVATSNPRPTKVCWYLPIIPRFKRLFATAHDASNLKWHAIDRINDGFLRHPADSPQWKTIDNLYPEFGAEPRNLRLGLASDGMNPFGNLSINHSSWPVLLMIYNLPPSLCMKRKYIMLSMMISGPRQPGNDIDVYLTPLIGDMRKLWVDGVDVYDANQGKTFRLHAMIFCTINDFPAYGNLSGYSVKGHQACPICEQNTSFIQLKHGKKTVYTRHRRFLKHYHPYRRLKKAFNGSQETEEPPEPLAPHEVYDRVKDIVTVFVVVRGILPKKVRVAINRLCFFFNAICRKVIDPKQLDDLENEAAIILCQLEMYFPPSFFDIMVHLIVHLVREIRLCGPVFLRWMYPVERYMKVLKGYTKNLYRPEASIVERYVVEEAIEFCSQYIEMATPVGLPQSRHGSTMEGRGTRGFNVVTMDRQQLAQAHLYVLHNTAEVIPYIDAHKQHLCRIHPKMNMMRLLQEHNRTFISWFRQTIFADDSASDTLRLLVVGLNMNVPTWKGYDINQYSFYTKSQDDKSSVQNSGVSVDGQSEHFCSAADNNPIEACMPYYGVIEEIWEVDYGEFRVPLFKCKWVNGNTGVRKDKMGFTLVDLKKVGYKDDPFIMAAQARQVFYVEDPCDSRWAVVLQGRTICIGHHVDGSTLDVTDMLSFSKDMPSSTVEQEEDDVYANRTDHDEGLWENIRTAMETPPPSPPQSENPPEVTSKRTRQSTRLRSLTFRCLDGPWPVVNVNPATGRGSGPHKEIFHSYLGVVAREKVPIVHTNWNVVPDNLKSLIWKDILRKFDIPEGQQISDPTAKYGLDPET